MNPEELVRNTWYIVYSKESKKIVGEIVSQGRQLACGEIIFTSYDKVNDSIMVSHAIPSAFKKICKESILQEASKYEYRRVGDLNYPKGHVHAKSPYYMRSWDAV
jgi:hypothetical protein